MPVTTSRDKFKDECGVFGVADHEAAANLTYLGLYALQHRGQEAAGIVSSDGKRLYDRRGRGHIYDVFDDDAKISALTGRSAIGHVRYSTAGDGRLENAQPILSRTHRGPLSLAHNGNLLDAPALRRQLEKAGAIFRSNSDTEVILHLLARSPVEDLTGALRQVLVQVRGAYSMVLLATDRLYAVRDPHGFRPLCLGLIDGSYAVASETCAFDLIGAEYVRDIEPGEILMMEAGRVESFRLPTAPRHSFCIFEHVYFSRPDSKVFGRSVNQSRFLMGKALARESATTADMVVPVPDSGVTSALGFARESGLPFELGLIRNHYVGRTFIEPQQKIRHFGVKVKLNPVPEILDGKRVILIDDSIVRGTTSQKIVELVRQAGAVEVHFRVTSPPTVAPCHYGINTPDREQLIASRMSVPEIEEYLGVDSLAYLSLEGLRSAVEDRGEYCAACFDENYPLEIAAETSQPALF